jgi:hypothetical protein
MFKQPGTVYVVQGRWSVFKLKISCVFEFASTILELSVVKGESREKWEKLKGSRRKLGLGRAWVFPSPFL